MIAEIKKSTASGNITAPPSKSFAHRALICAALASGKSVINNIELSNDIKATISVLTAFGADIKIDGKKAYVDGIKSFTRKESLELFPGESGSTLRFLMPLSLLFSEKAFFNCEGLLAKRPQSVYTALFSEHGCFAENDENTVICGGELHNGDFFVKGNVSSQFITGLLFALPLLDGDSRILLTTPLESAPYIDITLDVMKSFGIEINRTNNGDFLIKGNQNYKPCNLFCEGDWSNAAFLEAFILCGGSVNVDGLNEKSYQGDKIYREYFKALKCGSPTLDISDCPDLGPVLISAAALLNGAVFIGTKRLKIKESDRGEAMRDELLKFGADITVEDDRIIVRKAVLHSADAIIDSHNDHRIAMALSIVCSAYGGKIKNADCVKKSYPRFWEDISSLGINVEINGSEV